MKLMKNIIAVVIVFVMAFSVTGCHKKNEIAVTANGFEYTSAYYMCALINADNEPQIARKLRIMQAPTLVRVEDGKAEKLVGVGSITKYIEDNR